MGGVDTPNNISGKQFRVIASYEPQQSDELSLLVGDILTALHSYDDGWILAENKSTKAKGLAPGNFLEPYKHNVQISQPRVSAISPEPQLEYSMEKLHISDKFKAGKRNSSRFSNEQVYAARNPQLVINNKEHYLNPSSSNSNMKSSGSSNSSLSYVSHENQEVSRLINKLRNDVQNTDFSCVDDFSPAKLGSMNIFICGDTGIGKSSLIERIVNHTIVSSDGKSEKFVVSSMKPFPFVFENSVSNPSQNYLLDNDHSSIMLTKSSTIPLDLTVEGEEKFNLKVLELPGFGYFTDAFQTIRQSVEYCQRQFLKTNRIFSKNANTTDDQILKFIQVDNGSHQHVDACFYLILHRLKPVDLEYMHHISQFTNIIPIIIKSDTLSAREILQLKLTVLLELQKKNIPINGFGLTSSELIIATEEALRIIKESAMKKASEFDDDEIDSRLLNILEELKGLLPYAISSKKVISQDKKNLANGRPTTMLDISFSTDMVGTSPMIDRRGQSNSERKFAYPKDEFDYLFRDVFVKHIATLRSEVARKFIIWRTKLSS